MASSTPVLLACFLASSASSTPVPLACSWVFFESEVLYTNLKIKENQEIMIGFYDCLQRLVLSIKMHNKIENELTFYMNAD